MHFTENGSLKTTDTALAAYLIQQGYKLTKVEYNDSGQGLFLFTDSPELLDIIDPFYRGDLYRFFRIYRGLLKKIKVNQLRNSDDR